MGKRRLLWALAVAAVAAGAQARIMWSGAITDTSVVLAVERLETDGAVALVVSTNRSLTPVIQSNSAFGQTTGMFKWNVTNLMKDTQYYYGIPDLSGVGAFKTVKVNEVYNFSFLFGSCAWSGSTTPVFTRMKEVEDVAIFLQFGDLHYEDIISDNDAIRNKSYSDVFDSKVQAELFLEQPIAYMWDDHDFGANDADGLNPSKATAIAGYQSHVPHYPMVNPNPFRGIYQAFTIGRVRFILTDLRSNADLEADIVSTLNSEQRVWLANELSHSKDYGMVVWISSKAWMGSPVVGLDKWRGYADEREVIAGWIARGKRGNASAYAEGIPDFNATDNLIMVSGDAHLLGFDDGSHNDYANPAGGGFPVFQSSPITQFGSVKGTGPFSHGCFGYRFWINQHYSTMDVVDDGENITITAKGYSYEHEEPLTTLTLTSPFVKSGVAGDAGGGAICSMPTVPSFIWLCVGLLVLSSILLVVANVAWVIYFRRAERQSRTLACTVDNKVAKAVPKAGGSSPPPDPSEKLRPPSTASGVVSINPIHIASSKPRSPLIVVEPLAGDWLSERHV